MLVVSIVIITRTEISMHAPFFSKDCRAMLVYGCDHILLNAIQRTISEPLRLIFSLATFILEVEGIGVRTDDAT